MLNEDRYGQEDSALVDEFTLLYGTTNIKKDSFSLFYVGPQETNVYPGTGKGENNKMKKDWKEMKLMAYGENRKPWRQIFSAGFDSFKIYSSTNHKKSKATATAYKTYPFELDGLEWLSVTHYLLAMFYITDPDYAILFSLRSKDNPRAFWGELSVALEEHRKNRLVRNRQVNPNFLREIPKYLYNATLAKFTQHQELKELLLATGNAYLAERNGEHEVGLTVLMKVRKDLEENPDFIHRETDQVNPEIPPEFIKDKIIANPEFMNIGFEINNLLAGGVNFNNLVAPMTHEVFKERYAKSIKINREEVSTTPRWVYLITKTIFVDPDEFMARFDFSYNVIKRNVYGITRNYDSTKDHLLIGYETVPTTQTKLYRRYQTPNRIFYFEPMLNNSYSLMVITEGLDEQLVSGLKLIQISDGPSEGYQAPQFVLPEIKYTDSQLRSMKNNRRIIMDPLTYEQAIYQYNKIEEFITGKRISAFNVIMKKKLLNALRDELRLRSFTNGDRLLQAPGSPFVKEFSSRFGLDERYVGSFFEIESYPDRNFGDLKLPSELANPPSEKISKKHWILFNSIEAPENYYQFPRRFVERWNGNRIFNDEPFDIFRFKDVDLFRGYSWMENLPVLSQKEVGLRWFCEIPHQRIIEEVALEKLQKRLEEAMQIQQPLEVVLTCRTRGKLYEWLMKSDKVVFRRILQDDFKMENPFTMATQNLEKPILLAVARSQDFFPQVDLELLNF